MARGPDRTIPVSVGCGMVRDVTAPGLGVRGWIPSLLHALPPLTCSSLLPRAVGSPLVMDPTSICRKARRLAGRQAELCQAEPEVVAELARGARLGVRECQFQFRFRRWNCSSHSKAFGRILQQGQCGERTWGERCFLPENQRRGEQAWEGFRSPTSWPIYRHPGPPRGALHTVQIPISQGVSGLHSPQRHSLPRAGPRPQPPSVLRSDCPSLHPQTFGRPPSCLQLRQPAPATRSHRPVPWASCCSVAVRHPVGGPSLVLPACQAPPGLPGSQAPRRPAPPGSGEAAATTWTSGMKSQGCLWTRSTSAGVETSELWCNCTTTRLAGWCVPMGERTPVCEEWPRVHGAGMSEGV